MSEKHVCVQELGGAKYHFLTHAHDVAGHAEWQKPSIQSVSFIGLKSMHGSTQSMQFMLMLLSMYADDMTMSMLARLDVQSHKPTVTKACCSVSMN